MRVNTSQPAICPCSYFLVFFSFMRSLINRFAVDRTSTTVDHRCSDTRARASLSSSFDNVDQRRRARRRRSRREINNVRTPRKKIQFPRFVSLRFFRKADCMSCRTTIAFPHAALGVCARVDARRQCARCPAARAGDQPRPTAPMLSDWWRLSPSSGLFTTNLRDVV